MPQIMRIILHNSFSSLRCQRQKKIIGLRPGKNYFATKHPKLVSFESFALYKFFFDLNQFFFSLFHQILTIFDLGVAVPEKTEAARFVVARSVHIEGNKVNPNQWKCYGRDSNLLIKAE